MIRIFLFITSILLIASCSDNTFSTEEFVRRVEQSDEYNQVIERGEIIYSCRYLPPEYMAIRSFPSDSILNGNVSQATFKKVAEEYSRARYFQFRISRKDGSDISKSLAGNLKDYGRLQEYFTNGMLKDFFAENEKDKIFAINYQYNRTYGVSPFVDFLFVFPVTLPENCIFYYNVRLHTTRATEGITFEFKLAEIQRPIQLQEIR